MRAHTLKNAWLLTLCALPAVAYAQHIPVWLVFAVISPVVVLFFAIVLGFVSRSWQTGLLHAGLVVAWVLLFVLVSNIFTNDYVIWTPLVALAAHAVVILALIVIHIIKRTRARYKNESN